MTDPEPTQSPEPPPEPEQAAPKQGDTRVVNGDLQEFDGEQWGPYKFLPSAGSGGDGKPIVIYKFFDDFEVDG
jgi:hypothetical protein